MSPIAFEPLQPKVVLGVAAHPDDLEFSAAGSVARWVNEGATVYYFILTDASKGTSDRSLTREQLRDMRRDEQRQAAQILGVKEVFFADYEDGTLECTPQVKKDIARMIRKLQPDTVICMDPSAIYYANFGMINHPDHRAAGQATLDAVYPLARDHLSFPELLNDEHLEPHKVKHILMTGFEGQNYSIDISATFDTKLKALAAHKSQVGDLNTLSERMRQMASKVGSPIGAQYAESFTRLDMAI